MEGELRAEPRGSRVPLRGQSSLLAISCPSRREATEEGLLSLPDEMLDLSISERVGNPNICPSSQN